MTDSTGKRKKILKNIAALVFWIAVWAGAAGLAGSELILPGPLSVLETLGELCRTPDFWEAALLSLARIFGGFAAGLIAGTLLAAASECSSALEALLSPLMRVVRSTPVASFIILALLWVGRSYVPLFISALMVAPVIYGTVCTSVRGTDASLLEMARAYSFSAGKRLKLIYVPTAYPAWRSAAVTSMGLAWKSGVAAEVLCQPKTAVGTELYYSKLYLETPSLFAWTAVVILLSFLIEKLLVRGLNALAERRGGGKK